MLDKSTIPNYSNTLICYTKYQVDVINLHKTAHILGYKFYTWNDRVYETNSISDNRIETTYTSKDLK